MNPTPPTTSVLDEVATWPGVSTQPTPRGATAIVFEGHELGHVHSDRRTLDLPLPDDRRKQVLDAAGEGVVLQLGQQATRERCRRKRRHRAAAPKLRRTTPPGELSPSDALTGRKPHFSAE